MASPECRMFMDGVKKTDQQSTDACDNFVRKITEAVSPIVPITLRNKSLDGAYLRTALILLGAAEILFAQYEQDVRVQANPAGAVGLCQALHNEIERSTLYGDQKLKSLWEFTKEMKAQYQTSLGLGKPFVKDTSLRGRRRARRGRGRTQWQRNSLFQSQGFAGGQANSPRFGGGSFAEGRGAFSGIAHVGGRGGGTREAVPLRGRGICFDFQAGSCLRGRTCRFTHANQ